MSNNKDRRTFLKNVVLSSIGLGVLPNTGSSQNVYKNAKERSNTPPDCKSTTKDYYGQGPFYTPNAPYLANNKLTKPEEQGDKLIITGRVLNLNCSEFIPNTIVDIWHANNEGAYDNQGYNLRGYTKTNNQGFYLFETILPGKYLNGSKYRPSHIHLKITPPGHDPLITQLYFEGDTDIPGDAAASIDSGNFDATDRIITLSTNDSVLEGSFDIILNGEGIPLGTSDLHIEKGMIYNASPNPFTDEITINYGVFTKAKVGIVVYNLRGRLVAELENKLMLPAKYKAVWRPQSDIPSGHYFIAIKINDFQVHYLKVIKS